MMPAQRRIMQVVHSLDFGGLEKMVIDLSDELEKNGYRSIICCMDKNGAMIEQAKNKGLKVLAIGRKAGVDYLLPLKLANLIKTEKIEIVHTHNMGPMLYGTLGAWIARVPAVHTKHDRENKITSKVLWSAAWSMNKSVIMISEDARKEFLKHTFVEPAKVRVIRNGINVAAFAAPVDVQSKRNSLGIQPSEIVLGTVARLSKEKDQCTLIDAFAQINKIIPQTKLLIVGEGAMRDKLEDHAKERRILDNVMFLGSRTDVAEILAVLDVFVLTSLTEGISISLLEAMASGKPVIVTSVGGNPEVVTGGIDGILVPPKDAVKIAEAAVSLLTNSGLMQKMGQMARTHVRERFDLCQMVKQYEELYHSCFKSN
jgi:sugar transferase (PEP-CTERM/EpsH1 system associated)